MTAPTTATESHDPMRRDVLPMSPMDGVKVVEVAVYALVPGAGAVLADWGADVVKVEHPITGDYTRGLSAWGIKPGTGGFHFVWEQMNRGKKSVGIDLATPEGLELLYTMVRSADVFLVSFLPDARQKLRIDVEHIMAVNPRIIYARGSGYGPQGPEAEKGGFDGITFWQRTGIASACAPKDSDAFVPLPGPAFGDIQGAMALAGGVSAALFQRSRTGEGCVVDVSLLSTGMWTMSSSLVGANMIGELELPKFGRDEALNPLGNSYRTADGRFVALAMLNADRYWTVFCETIGHPELIEDPRFVDMKARRLNNRACIAAFDEIFASRTLAEWEAVLATQEGQWEVVRKVGELNDDEQAWANGYLQSVDYGAGRTITLVANPAQFNMTAATLRPAPELGADTEEYLLGMGQDWEDLARLKDSGVIN